MKKGFSERNPLWVRAGLASLALLVLLALLYGVYSLLRARELRTFLHLREAVHLNYGDSPVRASLRLAETLQLLGYKARLLRLSDHWAVEVLSSWRRRWILLDPFFNLHFERRGEPLGAGRVAREMRRRAHVGENPLREATWKGLEEAYRPYGIVLSRGKSGRPFAPEAALSPRVFQDLVYVLPGDLARDELDRFLRIRETAHQHYSLACGQAALLMVEMLRLQGYPARVVELSGEGGGHVTTEVWSEVKGRWIVMDAYFNLHFERGREPLGAADIKSVLERKGSLSSLPRPALEWPAIERYFKELGVSLVHGRTRRPGLDLRDLHAGTFAKIEYKETHLLEGYRRELWELSKPLAPAPPFSSKENRE